jgi:ABC-type multidrug transport system ATPase subunit
MNEYLLKAVLRLFAIVAKGNVTEESRENVKFMVFRQASGFDAAEYLKIFDEFTVLYEGDRSHAQKTMDQETEEFVEEWANIMLICKRINQESSLLQKVIVLLRVIELSNSEDIDSERRDNLIFYIGQTLNISTRIVTSLKRFVFGMEVTDFFNENILIVDDGSEEEYECCKHIERPNLTGFLAFLYISELESYFVKYVGISNVLLNGAILKSRFIYMFPQGSNLRGAKLRPLFYSDIAAQFKQTEHINEVRLTSSNLSVKFKNRRLGLRNIYLNEHSGKLVGIMGASGSGKSTFLETLNGKISPHKGQVLINGIDVHREPQKLEGLIGYVPQDDLLIEELTVFQNLYYASKLCFADLSDEQHTILVTKTLRSLGIYESRQLIVGNPLQKTISGGQRKRLNIALELLREPAILFLDEPTSGLSSRDSENILDLLKELSLKGKLVLTTIHQPSSDIFKMFDNLLLLDVGGYQIYYGDPVEAVVYFRDVVNMIQRDQGSCITCGNVSVEQIFNIIETRVVNEYGQYTDQRRISPAEWGGFFEKRLLPGITINNPIAKLPPTDFKIPRWLDQLKVFYKRDILSKLKNTQYLIVNFTEAPLLGLIIGYFVRYYNPGDDNTLGYSFGENPNIPYYFLMSIIVAMFIGLSISGEEIIKDRRILQRERFLNLSKNSYLTSKVLILFGISAIQTFTFVLVGNSLLEFRGMLLAYWLVLFSSACAANMLGLIISSAFNSVITIYILIPIILIPQLMFNGLTIDFDKLNPRISSSERVPILGELMIARWASEAIMVRQFKDNALESRFYRYDKERLNAQYKTSYYLSEIGKALSNCNAALRGEVPRQSVMDDLGLIGYELKKELEIFNKQEEVDWEKLTPTDFDSATFSQIDKMIRTLQNVYVKRSNRAFAQRDSITKALDDDYIRFEKTFTNERVAAIVRNDRAKVRIMEVGNKLIQKYNLIYTTPQVPQNPWNFRTYLYAPEKYFLGQYYDTFWFNIAIIWLMTTLAIFVLYLDLLRKMLKLLTKISDYKIRIQSEKE